MIKKIKYIAIGLFLLFLFHFESLNIGPIKVSHLWKGVLLVHLLSNFLRSDKKYVFIYRPLFFIALLHLINLELVNNTLNAFLTFGITLIIPLFGVYLIKYPIEKLKSVLLFVASFFVLAFIPYKLGLLESIKEGYNLEQYGTDVAGLIGPFQNVHAASMALGGSFLVILYFIMDKVFNRIYLFILLILCFYFLLNTYVRTGMAMAALGSVPIVFYFAKNNLSTRINVIFIGGIMSLLISTWVFTNPILLNRIKGKAANSDESESVEKVGSGRGYLWKHAIAIYSEENLLEKLIGIGQTETLNRMSKKVYHKVFPHNGFLQILLVNGLVGFVALIVFIYKVYKTKNKLHKKYFVLVKSLLFAFVIMSFVQTYDLLYFHILMMLAITLYIKKSYLLKENLKYNFNEISVSKNNQ
jgi:hypothetical protein